MMSETTENGTLAGRIGLLPGKAAGQEEMPPKSIALFTVEIEVAIFDESPQELRHQSCLVS